MNEAKFDALDDYRTSPLFSDAERAVLDYVTELTRDKQVNPSTFQRMAGHYSEREICEIVWLVASEHFYNIRNIGLNIHSDMLCDISKKRKSSHEIGDLTPASRDCDYGACWRISGTTAWRYFLARRAVSP